MKNPLKRSGKYKKKFQTQPGSYTKIEEQVVHTHGRERGFWRRDASEKGKEKEEEGEAVAVHHWRHLRRRRRPREKGERASSKVKPREH
ncbi:hypothetical protein U1Q18_039484 [Sarracenia purpurea var. burkii]